MNITLIGMAGAGKSTVGRALAEKISFSFIDVDDVLRENFQKPLHLFIDEFGDEGFMIAEERAIAALYNLENTIISPGGSVIYSGRAMEHLKQISKVIFLDTPFEVIEKRVDLSTRGLVGMKGKTLQQLYEERRPLYLKHASIIIDVGSREIDNLVKFITERLKHL